MSTFSSVINTYAQAVLDKLPVSVSGLLQGNSAARLLKQVDAVLMLFDDKLYDLNNGAWRSLTIDDEKSFEAVVAGAAHELLADRDEKPSVLLLLPPKAFIATHVNMPGVTKESLRSALALQSSVLLPSYEAPLVFTVNSRTDSDGSHDVVIWSDEAKIDLLYSEFAAQGLFLIGAMPRTVAGAALHGATTSVLVTDEDADTVSSVVYEDSVVREYLQVTRSDLDDPEFARQWEETNTGLESAHPARVNFLSAQDYCNGAVDGLASEYCFIPNGTQEALRQENKGKRIIYGAVAAVIVVLLASSPFLVQTFQLMRLDSQLTALKGEAVQAREDQAIVREFEISWGVLNEFPRQHIPEVLLQLQTVLSPNVLTSMEIDEGSVEIEGESADPQSLLQLLEQNSMFTGVDFARATNNNRYYIELRLSTVDYDAYRQWYFPDVRR